MTLISIILMIIFGIIFGLGYYLGFLRSKKLFADSIVGKFNYCYMDLTARKPYSNNITSRVKEYFLK